MPRGALPAALMALGGGALLPVSALGAVSTRAPQPPPHGVAAIWATINRCEPRDQPDAIGLRGSMPGDGKPADDMFMRFRLQFLDTRAHRWADIGGGADSGFVRVGGASRAMQAGRTFTITPAARSVRVRGVVSFQWRRGSRVAYAAERVTTAGHASNAGADPPHYSASTCLVK